MDGAPGRLWVTDVDSTLWLLCQARLPALEIFEEAVDLIFSFKRDETVFEWFGFEHGLGCVEGFALEDAGAQSVERCGSVVGGQSAGCVSLAYRAGAAAASEEHLCRGAGLFQLLLQRV